MFEISRFPTSLADWAEITPVAIIPVYQIFTNFASSNIVSIFVYKKTGHHGRCKNNY